MTQRIVNDFSITVGTANGSGSSTANNTILRALFKMGIPVSGKNLFPSNIQGLPTWYTIRVNKDGFTARTETHEIVIAMNPNSFAKDQAAIAPGGAFFYSDDIKQPITRTDIIAYPMPVKELVRNNPDIPTNLRDLVGNMIYVGILAQMIGMDMDKIEMAIRFHFKNKERPVALNMGAVKAGAEWAAANLTKKDSFYVEAMNKTEGLIMADGNTAGALGSIYGGVQFIGWYPITPATSLAESLNDYLPVLRKNPAGKETYAVVQAEDELAAVGMSIGAGWAGLRAMTSTSGPGLSLMTEFYGLAYYAEIPVVIWDVQRMGPSTGLPTRTSQGDLGFAAHMGHGDTNHIVLLPGSVNECFEFGWRAFDIAERIQTPVLVMSDLDFGMNQWMTEPFKYPDSPMDRGKVLWEEDLEKIKGDWGRYRDVDGDGIPYRTLPGNKHPLSAYFTRGTGHDEQAKYNEDSGVWYRNMERLSKKFETARSILPKPVLHTAAHPARIGVIAFGSTEPAIIEAQAMLQQQGVATDFLRLRALPISAEVEEFIRSHEQVFVVEMNRDGHLHEILILELPGMATRLQSIAYNDGLPLTARFVSQAILSQASHIPAGQEEK
jgi:2-oxoglutarate ferredoxin oxidoreductase subunit alpha